MDGRPAECGSNHLILSVLFTSTINHIISIDFQSDGHIKGASIRDFVEIGVPCKYCFSSFVEIQEKITFF